MYVKTSNNTVDEFPYNIRKLRKDNFNVRDKTQDEISSESKVARYERDELLTQCDWTQIPNSPLDSTIKASWATYRTALRDVTGQSGFPTNITWPTTP